MLKELSPNINEVLPITLGILPFILTFSPKQIKAIFKRDNYQCQFPDEHKCNNPKHITVHHIDTQSELRKNDINLDQADLVITICKNAHWKHLHNTKDSWKMWVEPLRNIVKINTEKAKIKGWFFPEK